MATFITQTTHALQAKMMDTQKEAILMATEIPRNVAGPLVAENTPEAADTADSDTSHDCDGPDPKTLLDLLKASPECQRMFKRYYRTILQTYAEEILPKDPQLVRDALQARCSKGRMIVDVFSNQNTWNVRSKASDVWDNIYSGKPIDALINLIELTTEVKSFADSLLDPMTNLPKNIAVMDRATVEEALWLIEVEINRGRNLLKPKLTSKPNPEKNCLTLPAWRRKLGNRVRYYDSQHPRASKLATAIHAFFRTPEGKKLYRRISTSQGLVFPRNIWMFV